MARNLAQGMALVTLVAFGATSSANAQTKAPPLPERPSAPAAEIAPAPLSGTTSDWRASQLIGATMTNVIGDSVGTVEDVVIDADGKVVAVMVGVGGFLGLGETSVAIGLRHLSITHVDLDQLEVKTSLSRKAIEQAAALGPRDDSPLPEGLAD